MNDWIKRGIIDAFGRRTPSWFFKEFEISDTGADIKKRFEVYQKIEGKGTMLIGETATLREAKRLVAGRIKIGEDHSFDKNKDSQ